MMTIDFTLPALLHAHVAAVCPIDGVSIGEQDDRTTWRIDARPEATAQEREAAQAALASFVTG
jgi:hypothetical protein